MGHGDSKEEVKLKAAISKLDKMELKDLEAVFLELSSKTDEGEDVIKQPTWLNRDKFAQVLGTNEFLIEELFSAFDRDENGMIDLQEFITGMALCLDGSIKNKCDLLFKIFNLNNDEGVDPEELSLVLTNCLQSAHTLLRKTSISQRLTNKDDHFVNNQASEAALTSALVEKIVKDAFEKCDVSHTGKLDVNEFANWVHKNPKLINNVFVLQCPKVSSETGESNPSFNIDDENDDEGNTKENTKVDKETCIVGTTDDTPVKPPPTLKDLFSQSKPDASDFFDSIGTNQLSNENAVVKEVFDSEHVNESAPRRTQSEVFTTKHFGGFNEDVPSGSEVDLSHFSMDIIHPGDNRLAKVASESLYSIALSQNSLVEEKDLNDESPGADPSINNAEGDPSDDMLSSDTREEPTHGTGTDVQQRSHSSCGVIETVVADEIGVECVELSDSDARVDTTTSADLLRSRSSTVTLTSFWQPNVQTTQLLQLAAQGNIPEYKLIQPIIAVDNSMSDPVKELVAKYLGEEEASKRPTPNIHQVELTDEGLHKLLQSRCWRGALDFTKMYLEAHNVQVGCARSKDVPLLTPNVIQVWYVRIALLIRLRMYSSAEIEINAFNDFESPDLYYQFYPDLYPNCKGCMVPFSFRLLHAEIPQYNGKADTSLDRLYSLLSKLDIIHENLSQGLTERGDANETLTEKEIEDRLVVWKKRIVDIHYSLANCFISMKEYLLSVKLLEKIIVMEPSREISLLSAIGRVYLQLGDCTTAQKYFKRIAQHEDAKTLSMMTMNMAYTSLTKGLYKDAYQQFLSALHLDESNLAACNNAAVCLLFMGKVKEASDILETMVCQSPEKSLHEEILLNLTTVYELETSRALQKKHKLLDLVSKHKGDGFNVQCLKLT